MAMLWENVGALSTATDDIDRQDSTPHRIELHNNTPMHQRTRWFGTPIVEKIEHQLGD